MSANRKPQGRTVSTPGPTRIVEVDGVRVAVCEAVLEDRRGRRYVAELSLSPTDLGGAHAVSIIDGRTPRELARLLDVALPAFVRAVRLRQRFSGALEPEDLG